MSETQESWFWRVQVISSILICFPDSDPVCRPSASCSATTEIQAKPEPGRISFPEPEQSAGFCSTKQGLVETSAFNDLYRTATWVNWSRTFNVWLMKIKTRGNKT